jgi:hypothetical protein
MSPIYMIAGEQGDGKSLFTMALLDYLTNHGKDCLLIDSDTINPDVHTIYSQEVCSEILDLSILDGWIQLANLCESNWGKTIVINGAANGIEGIEKHSKLFFNCLFALQQHLVTFWVVSPDTSSLDTLDRYKKVVGRRIVHIVRNQKYKNSSILLDKRDSRHEEFRRNGRIMYLPDLDQEEHKYFAEAKITIKKYLDSLEQNSSSFSKMFYWRGDIKDYIFLDADYGIKDLINTGDKTYYHTFSRRLADEIEENLKGERREKIWDSLFYSPPDRTSEAVDIEDIGEGKVSIEDLAAAAANGEDLAEEDRRRLTRALEPETEEEYQEKLRREYMRGADPSDFMPSAADIKWRSRQEYIEGGNPKNFTLTAADIHARALNEYRQGRQPVGFVPTQAEIDGIDDTIPF